MSQSVLATPRYRSARAATLIGYFALLSLILLWFTVLSPPKAVPRSLLLTVLAVPMLFPLRGLLHGRRYTHQWASLLSLFYFVIGVDVFVNRGSDQAYLGALMVVFSLLWFVGCISVAKLTGKPRRPRAAPDESTES